MAERGRCRVEGCPGHPTPGHGISVCGEHEREWDRAWKGYDWFNPAAFAPGEKQEAWARFLKGEPIHG